MTEDDDDDLEIGIIGIIIAACIIALIILTIIIITICFIVRRRKANVV